MIEIGGIQDGVLFESLPMHIRFVRPVIAAASPYRDHRTDLIFSLFQDASRLEWWPEEISQSRMNAFAGLMFYHQSVSADARAAASLHCTTTGILASVHGLSHEDRAVVALLLTERWGGEMDPYNARFLRSMKYIVGPEVVWWTRYLGRVAHLLGTVYPTPFDYCSCPRVRLNSEKSYTLGSKGQKTGIRLRIEFAADDPMTRPELVTKLAQDIVKVGKKKNWVEGYGKKIDVIFTTIDSSRGTSAPA